MGQNNRRVPAKRERALENGVSDIGKKWGDDELFVEKGVMTSNGDGTWAVLSEGDFKYLCVTQFDIDENELSFSKTMPDEENKIDIMNAIRFGDGYLVQFNPENVYNGASIVKLGRDGTLLDKFVYESDDCDYCITDMAQFEGKVYLSVCAAENVEQELQRDLGHTGKLGKGRFGNYWRGINVSAPR